MWENRLRDKLTDGLTTELHVSLIYMYLHSTFFTNFSTVQLRPNIVCNFKFVHGHCIHNISLKVLIWIIPADIKLVSWWVWVICEVKTSAWLNSDSPCHKASHWSELSGSPSCWSENIQERQIIVYVMLYFKRIQIIWHCNRSFLMF